MKAHVVSFSRLFGEKNSFKGLAFGWGNGYCIIPPESKLFGVGYEELDSIDVHGGLTYSGKVSERDVEHFNLPEDSLGSWLVGFDTAHYGDNKENWSEQAVREEAERLVEQLVALEEAMIRGGMEKELVLFETWWDTADLSQVDMLKRMAREAWLARAKLSKPSWKDAPEWANWLAQDHDGAWYWYELKPRIDQYHNFSNTGGEYEAVREVVGWQDSLEQRPTKKEL